MLYIPDNKDLHNEDFGHVGLVMSRQLTENLVYAAVCGHSRGFVHLSNGYRSICGNFVPRNGVALASLSTHYANELLESRGKCKRCYDQTSGLNVPKSQVTASFVKMNMCNYPSVYSAVEVALFEKEKNFLHWGASGYPVFDMGDMSDDQIEDKIKSIKNQSRSICKSLMNVTKRHRSVKVPFPNVGTSVIYGKVPFANDNHSINRLVNLFDVGSFAFPQTAVRVLAHHGIVLMLSAGTVYYVKGRMVDSEHLTLDVYDNDFSAYL